MSDQFTSNEVREQQTSDMSLEELVHELDNVDSRITTEYRRRGIIRNELGKRYNGLGEYLGKADEKYYMLLRGEGDSPGIAEDMPMRRY
jgi:hypothetical protein